MAKPEIKLNHGNIAKILKGAEVQAMLSSEAKARAPKRPDVEVSEPFVGRARARVEIRTNNKSGEKALRESFGR